MALGDIIRGGAYREILIPAPGHAFITTEDGTTHTFEGAVPDSAEALATWLRELAGLDPETGVEGFSGFRLPGLPADVRLSAALGDAAPSGGMARFFRAAVRLPTLEAWVAADAMSERMARFLVEASANRENILVVGGDADDRAELLAALARAAQPGQRVAAVETTAPLPLGPEDHHVLLFNGDLATAADFAPDRLLVGDLADPDQALEFIDAMDSGLRGGTAAIFGHSVRDGLRRLENHLRRGGEDAPLARDRVAGVLHTAVSVQKDRLGNTRIFTIASLQGVGEGGFKFQELMRFEESDHGGRFVG